MPISPSLNTPTAVPKPTSFTFDLLRALALICIILAHSDPGKWIELARNMDVILIVLISGAVCALGSAERSGTWISYIGKRASRLLVPTYVFLSLVFIAKYLFSGAPYDLTTVLRTYLLLDGIGYVWILRVFLLISVLAHPLLALKRRTSGSAYLAIIAASYLVYEVVYLFFAPAPNGWDAEAVEAIVFYAIPYGCVFALGMRWPAMSFREALGWGFAGMGIFVGLVVAVWAYGEHAHTQAYKYPPRLTYVWYGIGASHLLLAAAMWVRSVPAPVADVVRFVSRNSLWVYLWHIVFLQLSNEVFAGVDAKFRFIPVFLATMALSIAAYWFQRLLVQYAIERSRSDSAVTHVLRGALL